MDLASKKQLDELRSLENPGFDFFSSAGTGENVETAFESLARRILRP